MSDPKDKQDDIAENQGADTAEPEVVLAEDTVAEELEATDVTEEGVTLEGEATEVVENTEVVDDAEAVDTQNAETAAEPAPAIEEPAPAATSVAQNADKPGKSKLAVVALILALLALAAVGYGAYVWIMQQQQEQSLQGQVQATATTQASLQARITQLETQLQSAQQAQLDAAAAQQTRIESLQSELGDELATAVSANEDANASQVARFEILQAELTNIHNKLGASRRAWIESEVEYLLRYANERLQLFRDHKGAMVALESADARILELGDPGFFDVRKVIHRELVTLKTARVPDVSGASLRLLALAEKVPALRLPYTKPKEFRPSEAEQAEQAEQGELAKAMSGIWTDLQSLVTIRRDDSPYEPMLAPEARTFLYQNLQVQLESARLALLLGDAEQYRRNIVKSQKWLVDWFDQNDAAVSGMQADLKLLSELNLETDIPDISRSLQAMRNAIKRRDGLDAIDAGAAAGAE